MQRSVLHDFFINDLMGRNAIPLAIRYSASKQVKFD